MAALDAATLTSIRGWVGSQPGDAAIEALFDTDGFGTAEACALQILRQRRADLEQQPAEWRLDGDYQQKTEANLKVLGERIAQLEGLVGAPGAGLAVARLYRCDTGR